MNLNFIKLIINIKSAILAEKCNDFRIHWYIIFYYIDSKWL